MTERKTQQAAIETRVRLDTPNSGMSPNDSLELAFSNGKLLALQIGDLSPTIIAQAVMHGLKQKLVDAAAISRDPETGRAATIDTKYAAVKEVYDRLLAGEWNKRREGGSGSAGGLLLTALCRLYPKKTPEALKEYLDRKSDAEKAALRKTGRIAAEIERIKVERADDKGIDGAELLAELDSDAI